MSEERKNEWKKVESVVMVRKGMREGWYEMRMVKGEGEEVKLVAKRVKWFYSEMKEVEDL